MCWCVDFRTTFDYRYVTLYPCHFCPLFMPLNKPQTSTCTGAPVAYAYRQLNLCFKWSSVWSRKYVTSTSKGVTSVITQNHAFYNGYATCAGAPNRQTITQSALTNYTVGVCEFHPISHSGPYVMTTLVSTTAPLAEVTPFVYAR